EYLAQRMMGAGDCYVDDDEKFLSTGYGKVRLSEKQEQGLAGIRDEKERERQRKALLKRKRQAVHDRLDTLAWEEGYDGADDLAAEELDDAQREVSRDNLADGKTSEEADLFAAGDTTLGLGKDAGKFYEILGPKTPKEMADFADRFEAKYHVNFEKWL